MTTNLNIDPRNYLRAIILFILLASLLTLLVGCGSTRQVTQPQAAIHRDTVHVNAFQHDSVYISQSRFIDRSCDTLYITDRSIEYRYRTQRDTIRIIHRDSIPYQVRVTEIKEIRHIPSWIKPFACIGFIATLLLLIYLFTKLKGL